MENWKCLHKGLCTQKKTQKKLIIQAGRFFNQKIFRILEKFIETEHPGSSTIIRHIASERTTHIHNRKTLTKTCTTSREN